MKRLIPMFLALAALATNAAAQVSINNLPNAAAIGGTEKLPVAQGAGCATHSTPCNTVGATPAQIAVYVASSTPVTTTLQPLDSDLTAIAALTTTAHGRGLLDDANAAASRTSLALGTIATQDAATVAITGGSVTGITDLAVADGGTGASNGAGARTNLGLVINTDVQAYDADLATYASITPSANVQTLLGSANYGAFRTSLGVALGSDVQAYDADLATYAGIAPSADVQALLATANDAAFRTELGLGSAATNASSAFQAADADLDTFAGISPSANVQTLLGVADYSAFRSSLGVAIGTNVQAYDADLTTYAGISPSADVQSLLGAADYAAMRTALSVVVGTNVQAYDADLTTYAGITPSADVQSLLAAANDGAFRTDLGLGSLATQSGTFSGTSSGTNTGDQTSIVGITGTIAQFNTAVTDADIQPLDSDLTTWAGVTPGTGVAAALAVNVGTAGAFVTNGGALGTPSSGTLTNATGLPVAGITASTSTALGVGSVELGHATDTTLARVSAGVVSVEGNTLAPLNNPVFTGAMYFQQGAPAANTAATHNMTAAEMLGYLITETRSTAIVVNLPTGTNMDSGVLAGLATDRAFEWVIINLGSSTGAATVTAATGHTVVGNMVCAISVSCRFLSRHTATNTWITYRL